MFLYINTYKKHIQGTPHSKAAHILSANVIIQASLQLSMKDKKHLCCASDGWSTQVISYKFY